MAQLLSERGFEVTLLLDGEATRGRIAEAIGDRLPREVEKNDRVLIYFAGHAVTVGSGDGMMGYLMPVDGDNERRVSTGISMREVQAWLSAQAAKHSMFVADACYSGLALSTRATGLPRTLANYLAQALSKDVRLALAAGRSDQQAYEWNGHGLFTYFFLEGLKGQADANGDGIVTSSELYAYIEPNVSQTALANWNARQNPQIGRSGQGEFVFLVPAGNLSSSPVSDSTTDRDRESDPALAGRGSVDPVDLDTLLIPIARHEDGMAATYDASSGQERSRFKWTSDVGRDASGRTVVSLTEEGSGAVAPFPQSVSWKLESTWMLEDRFAPLRVERTYSDSAGSPILVLRHEFDWGTGKARFTRIDQSGKRSTKTLKVPADTITGDGLALWLRALPFESPRPAGFHLLSDEPNLYQFKATIGERQKTQTAAGVFDSYRVQLDVDLGLFNVAKLLLPKTFLWFSTEPPHIWLRSESLENGLGTPKIYRELLSRNVRN